MTRSLAILTTLALVLAACGSTPVSGTTGGAASATPGAAKPIYGGTVTFGLENDVSNLDPMLSGLFVDRNIHYAMYDSLVRVSPKGDIIPWLAESWKYSDDVKNDHYTLEKNPDWWGTDKDGNKLPYLDKIIVKPIIDADVRLTNLRTGDLQIINQLNGKDVPAVQSDPTLTYQQVGSFSWKSLVPNEAPGYIFNEKRYVKAVAMAIDRDEILAKGPAHGVV